MRIECLRAFETVEWLENLPQNLLLVSVDGRTLSEERDSREVSGQCEPRVACEFLNAGKRKVLNRKLKVLSFRAHGRGGKRRFSILYNHILYRFNVSLNAILHHH